MCSSLLTAVLILLISSKEIWGAVQLSVLCSTLTQEAGGYDPDWKCSWAVFSSCLWNRLRFVTFPEGAGHPQQCLRYNNSLLSQLLGSLSFYGWYLKRALGLDVFPKVLGTKLEKNLELFAIELSPLVVKCGLTHPFRALSGIRGISWKNNVHMFSCA